MLQAGWKAAGPEAPQGPRDSASHAADGYGLPLEDLAYRIELWDEAGVAVERILACTSSASLGYAAYYAAAREYPERDITLTHRDAVMSRWVTRSR